VYFVGCRQLTKTSSPVIYHILHLILAANLVDNLITLTLKHTGLASFCQWFKPFFSALTLLVGCQEGHPAHKNLTVEVLAWLSSRAKCK